MYEGEGDHYGSKWNNHTDIKTKKKKTFSC